MRILFTGLGSIGRRHLRLLREREQHFEYVAYRSGARETETPEDVRAVDSLSDGLALNPSVVFVTNPTNRHVETAIDCARAGCDLFVEKPLSHSRERVDELCRIVRKYDVVSHVGCQLRFHPVLRRIRSAIVDNVLGDTYSFRAYSGSYLPDWRPERDYRETYSSSRESGGGVLLDLIHEIDYTHWLFDGVDETEGLSRQVSHLDVDAEDIAEIVLTTDGTIGNIHLDYFRRTPRRTLEVICERGTISANLLESTIKIEDRDGVIEDSYDLDRDDLFRQQLDYFLMKLQSGESTMNDVHQAADVLDIAMEVRDNND